MKREVLSVEDVPINSFHQLLCVRSGGGWVMDGYVLTILWFIGAALSYIIGNLIISQGGPDAWRLVLASPAVIGLALILIRPGHPGVAPLADQQRPL